MKTNRVVIIACFASCSSFAFAGCSEPDDASRGAPAAVRDALDNDELATDAETPLSGLFTGR
jgi:hypothetical protein